MLCSAPINSRNLSIPPTRSAKYLRATLTPVEENSPGFVKSNSNNSSSAVFFDSPWRVFSPSSWFCDSTTLKNEDMSRPSGVLRTWSIASSSLSTAFTDFSGGFLPSRTVSAGLSSSKSAYSSTVVSARLRRSVTSRGSSPAAALRSRITRVFSCCNSAVSNISVCAAVSCLSRPIVGSIPAATSWFALSRSLSTPCKLRS